MSRTDDDLYTGINSASFATVRKKRTDVAEEKEKQRVDAFKNGALILEQLDKDEADLATRVFYLIDNADKEEDVRAKLLALKLERERIIVHRAQFERLLRPKKGQK